MSKWKTYRLGDIIQLKSGGTPDKSNPDYWGGSIPWISAKSMYDDFISTSDLFITEEGLQAGSKIAKKDSILLLTRGSGLFNRIPVCYVVSDVAYNQDVKNIVLKQEDVTSIKFLYYWLYGNKELLSSMLETTGIGAGKIDTKRFLNLSISLPSQKEQARYIHLMDLLFDKIELNRRINANLEAQAQALFRSWFVDFEPFRDGPFVDSELGKIPQGWKVGTLSEIGDVIGGGTPSKIVSEYYTDNGIAWITPKDLSTNNCKFTSKGETDISELGYKNSSAKLMPRGSVLFSSRAPIGYISIAKNEICTNQGFKSIVPKKAGTCFIYYFLRNNTSKIESMASGSTFKEASGGLMKSLEVIIPSNKILTAFEEAIQPLFNMQEHNEDENARLSALRDTLLPKLMAGEINLH